MKKVEIYDQFNNIYQDSSGQLVELSDVLRPGTAIDPSYTLVHQSSGFTVEQGTNLTDTEANNLVTDLYNQSKTLGSTYTDKIVKLEEGYAELKINFADGRVLNRVIYVANV